MTASDLLAALGVPRASIDADVVADLDAQHVVPFVTRLEATYYVEAGRIRAAVEARRSFNLIHLATMFKIDVFVSKRRPFDREAQGRARLAPLDDAAELDRLVETARAQMERNLGTGVRRTTSALARERLWVYERAGRPCRRCGMAIRWRRQGEQARSTWWCPRCQPALEAT